MANVLERLLPVSALAAALLLPGCVPADDDKAETSDGPVDTAESALTGADWEGEYVFVADPRYRVRLSKSRSGIFTAVAPGCTGVGKIAFSPNYIAPTRWRAMRFVGCNLNKISESFLEATVPTAGAGPVLEFREDLDGFGTFVWRRL